MGLFQHIMSLLLNMLSNLVIAFLPRSKCLLISWLQSPSTVILEPKKIKPVTVSIVSPSICHEVMGPDAMIFIFLMLSFKPACILSFTFIKRLNSSSFSAIGWCHLCIWGYWYFSLETWFWLELHPAWQCLYSTYKLNKHGGDIPPWHTPCTVYNQSVVPYPVLTVAFWPAYRKQVMWAGIPIFLKIFHSFVCLFVWSTQSKQSFKSILKETEVNVFGKFPCIFCDPLDVGSLISSSYAFSKPSLYI